MRPTIQGRDEDFSERLLQHIERITLLLQGVPDKDLHGKVTEHIYSKDINELSTALGEYLQEKDTVWLLIDNIDKGWPTRGTTQSDIVIVRSFRGNTESPTSVAGREVEFNCLVFLRTDIYEHLLEEENCL